MPTPLATPVPRPEWAPLPRPGCHGVEFKVLLQQPGLVIALLRFGPNSTIDEHSADFPVDVICLEGVGMFSMGFVDSHCAHASLQWYKPTGGHARGVPKCAAAVHRPVRRAH